MCNTKVVQDKSLTALIRERKNHQQLIAALSDVEVSVFVVNNDFTVHYMNDHMITLFGNQVGKTCYKSVAGRNSPCDYCKLSNVIQQLDTVSYQPTLEDGRVFSIIGTPIENKNGSISKLEVIKDVTQQQLDFDYRKTTSKALENSQDGVVVTDNEAKIISINSSFTRITGYTEEEVIGKNPFLLASGKHNKSFYQTMWRQLLSTGYWEGEVDNKRKNGSDYTQWLRISVVEGNNHVLQYVGVLTDLSQSKENQLRIAFLTDFDVLTGLLNARGIKNKVEKYLNILPKNKDVQSVASKLAFVFININQFSIVNDTKGHSAGDLLLQLVADKLLRHVGEHGWVCRYSGDCFLIVFKSSRTSDIRAFVEKEQHHLQKSPFIIEDVGVHISTSVGGSIFPNDGLNYAELLKKADIALHATKTEIQQGILFFSTYMSETIQAHFYMENKLKSALINQEFYLHFQPQFNAKTKKLIGAEALIRWQCEGEIIPPDKFIPVAEKTGMIIDIGVWVLRTACMQTALWRELFAQDMIIAINLSAKQFLAENLPSLLQSILIESKLPPHCLELEITESIIIDNVDRAIDTFNQLKRLGVGLAIDDFGTGYSSLSYLKSFPIDKLKIDKSFIDDLCTDRKSVGIAKTIILLAHELDMQVIAEGVETNSQLLILKDLGCDEIQGYYLGKPMPTVTFENAVFNS